MTPEFREFIARVQAVQYTGEKKQTELLLEFFKRSNVDAEFFRHGDIPSINGDCIFVDTKLGYEPLKIDDYVVVDPHTMIRIVPKDEFENTYV